MARKLLGDIDPSVDGSETPSSGEAAARPLRRSSLVTGGAAAPKYVEGSARSKTDRTHQDIPIDQIQESQVEDRIDVNEDLEQLVESIEKNGQQIPVIVRIVNLDKPYEIVAGRRRIAALRKLGKSTVKGFITRMTDKEAFIAQGIENSARLETSFIERARTVVKAYEHGFDQREVADFFGISQTLINFMSRIYEAVGEELVMAIGPARGIGRGRWEKLTIAARERNYNSNDLVKIIDPSLTDSVHRFERLLAAVETGKTKRRVASRSTAAKRTNFLNGQYAMTRKPGQLLLTAGRSASHDLLDFITEKMPDLIEEFGKREDKLRNTDK